MNLLPATVVACGSAGVTCALADGTRLNAAVDGSTLEAGAAVNLGLRPEHALADGTGESLSGRVQMVEHLGEVNLLYLALDCGADAVVRGDGGQAVQIGQRLSFQVDMAAFHLFDESGRAMRRLQPGNLAATRRVPAPAEAPAVVLKVAA
jgi:ABC-type sugar transport system ATPase subunit